MMIRPARTPPRTILLAAVLFIAMGGALEALAPWFLPVRIIEGPMIQQATENGVTLIWYTTRPLPAGACEVCLAVDPQDPQKDRRFAAQAVGTRQCARLDGLDPDRVYHYRIRVENRALAEADLRTNRRPGEPFSFIVFGDSGMGSRLQYQLAGQMLRSELLLAATPPDFVVHTGDLIYPRGQRSGYKDRFFGPYRHLLAQVDFWPALGNHDVADPDLGSPYLNVFDLPDNGPPGLPAGRSYWFDYASARIAVIDSNVDEATMQTHLAPWLNEVLRDCRADWKFVSLHHPPYTAGKHRPNLSVQRMLVPVFEAGGVNVVFCGHDHLYERTHALRGGEIVPDGAGVVYIVTGAGGGELYHALPPAQRPPYIACFNDQQHSFTNVRIDGDQLTLRQIDLDGRVLDEWSLTRPACAPAPPLLPPASAPASEPEG